MIESYNYTELLMKSIKDTKALIETRESLQNGFGNKLQREAFNEYTEILKESLKRDEEHLERWNRLSGK